MLGGEVAIAGGVDEGAGGTGGVVEKGFVPAAGSVVDVDGRGGGFDRGETIVVVERVEEFLVQHASNTAHGSAVEADGRGAVDCVVVGFGPVTLSQAAGPWTDYEVKSLRAFYEANSICAIDESAS